MAVRQQQLKFTVSDNRIMSRHQPESSLVQTPRTSFFHSSSCKTPNKGPVIAQGPHYDKMKLPRTAAALLLCWSATVIATNLHPSLSKFETGIETEE